MRHGRVYWITGLSGSGKTTIGTALYYELRKNHDNVIILDGDILKLFMGDKVGYSNVDRFQRASKYSKLCKVLADQGMYVIICTIAMFDEIRLWNRRHIYGYIEIFLDVSMDVLFRRDKKKLYCNSTDGKDVVGIHNNVQFPKDPDIKLKTDGSMSIAECIRRIEQIVPRNEDDFNRDSIYWDTYYAKFAENELFPSAFAVYCLSQEIDDKSRMEKELLEIGCGNGRDSLYFLDAGINVTGIDASEYAIEELKKKTAERFNAFFMCDDFVKCKVIYQKQYDYIYSRFTLHAINEIQQEELFANIITALKPGGKLFIEARTIRDDLYGKGERVGKNEYIYNNHYRRFLDKENIRQKICGMGLQILSLEESRGFSRTHDSDPMLMRLVAIRPE